MNDRNKLRVYPITKTIDYRSKFSSYDLNQMISSLEESTLRSILRGSELSTDLQKLKLGVETSYTALSKHVNSLLTYENMSGELYASAYKYASGGHIDQVAGIATLDWNSDRNYSKIPRYDSDNDGINDRVAPSVEMYVDSQLRTTDDSCYNALNRRNDSFWIEQATPGSHTIEINLPASINKYINYIELAPFPAFGMNITSISVYNIYGSVVNIYNSTNNEYKFYNNSGPMVLHFAPKEYNNRILINVETIDGIDSIGFTSVDAGLIDYIDGLQTSYLKFFNIQTPRTSSVSYTIDTAELDFYINDTDYSKYIDSIALVKKNSGVYSELTKLKEITNLKQNINATITLDTTDELYLEIKMREYNMTSPVFRGCKLIYRQV